MDIVSTLVEAKRILAKDQTLMIRMDNEFECWIQEGMRDTHGNLVANGRKVAPLAEDVFHELAREMDQVFCSEFFQRDPAIASKAGS